MKPLDEAMGLIDKNKELAQMHLDRQAIVVRAVDKRIEAVEKQKTLLEQEKQRELEKMQDFMELGLVNTHSLPDGYTVSYDHKRKLKISSVSEFLRWMKVHCQTSEVLTFFDGSLKAAEVKKFVERQCDKQRSNGIMDPKVDGIEIGDITFRRLTTFYKEKDNGK